MKVKKNNYAIACTETLEIINLLNLEDYNKIPEEIKNILEENKDIGYTFEYDYSKELNEQNIDNMTRGIIANLFENYLADDNEKIRIKILESNQYQENEELKKAKYNPDDLFKNKKHGKLEENNTNIALIECEEKFFIKLKNFIFKLFHKKIN